MLIYSLNCVILILCFSPWFTSILVTLFFNPLSLLIVLDWLLMSFLDSLSKTTLALAEYNKKNNSVTEEVEMSDSLSKLSNYLTEHVENDLIPALFDKATSLVQIATSRPESYTTNEEEGKHLNVGVFWLFLCVVCSWYYQGVSGAWRIYHASSTELLYSSSMYILCVLIHHRP